MSGSTAPPATELRCRSALVAAALLTAGLIAGAPPARSSPADAPTVGFVGDSIPFEALNHYDTTILRDRAIVFNQIGLALKIRQVLPAVREAVRNGAMPDIFVAFIGTSQSESDPPSVWRRELRQLLDLVSPEVDCVRVFEVDDTDTNYYLLHDRYAAAYNRITHAVSHEYDNVDWFHYDLWAELVGPEWERRDQLHHNVYGRVHIARLMREVTNSCDPALTSGPFWDVPDSDAAAGAIAWVGQRHLFGGYANGTYRARVGSFVLPATRGALLNMAWRLGGRPGGYPEHPWTDGRPALDAALRWAAATQIDSGFADGTYRPDTPVSRIQAVGLLWRMAGRPVGFDDDPWSDAEGPAVRWAAVNHLLPGATATTFRPDARLGRGLLARLLFAFDALPSAPSPPSPPPTTPVPSTTVSSATTMTTTPSPTTLPPTTLPPTTLPSTTTEVP